MPLAVGRCLCMLLLLLLLLLRRWVVKMAVLATGRGPLFHTAAAGTEDVVY